MSGIAAQAGRDVAEPGLDKSGRAIREMFAAVAPRYDALNHLLSAWLDLVWRRRAARALDLSPGSRALDVCCGTGDQARALAERNARVVAADFCLPMLALARRKYGMLSAPRPSGVAADALVLPFPSASFAGLTVAFGLRNVADLDRALSELHRVLAPGGRLAVLEFAIPRRRPVRWAYLLYFRHVLPRIAKLLSPRGAAYEYLRDSVLGFPQRDALVAQMRGVGFSRGSWRDLSGGVVCLYTARRTR